MTYDPEAGEWWGWTYLPYEQLEVFVNAVVAPPTSRQLFEYYEQNGGGKPLTGIPVECENKARIRVIAPTSHKGPA